MQKFYHVFKIEWEPRLSASGHPPIALISMYNVAILRKIRTAEVVLRVSTRNGL
jgi:hypothetical protein